MTMPNESTYAKEKRSDPGPRQNAKGDHEGSAHRPEEFAIVNPQKQAVEKPKTDIPPANSTGDR